MTPETFAAKVSELEEELARVIVGQQDLVRSVLLGLLSEGHVLLEGVPGLGKTLLLRSLGDALGVAFGRVQFTPDLMPADIIGTNVLSDGGFSFHSGPVFANVVLADEVNRATPKTQSALLEAMQERQVTLSGVSHQLPRPFFVMATQNPLEMEGTYPLPEAQLDRFLFKVLVPFPSQRDLVDILERTTGVETVEIKPTLSASELTDMLELVREVPVGTHLLTYAAMLISATHPNSPLAPDRVKSYVRYGASPRGAQAMILGSKARTLVEARTHATTEDMHFTAPLALRHRMVLGYEAAVDGVTADSLVADILEAHPAPTVTE